MTRVIQYRPLAQRHALQREVDRLFNRAVGRPIAGENGARPWAPRVDVAETEDGFHLVADLPGLNRKDVSITFENGVLTISGERADTFDAESTPAVRRERWTGRFERAFEFTTDVDASRIKATVRDGVLRIDVPRAEQSKPVRITVS